RGAAPLRLRGSSGHHPSERLADQLSITTTITRISAITYIDHIPILIGTVQASDWICVVATPVVPAACVPWPDEEIRQALRPGRRLPASRAGAARMCA